MLCSIASRETFRISFLLLKFYFHCFCLIVLIFHCANAGLLKGHRPFKHPHKRRTSPPFESSQNREQGRALSISPRSNDCWRFRRTPCNSLSLYTRHGVQARSRGVQSSSFVSERSGRRPQARNCASRQRNASRKLALTAPMPGLAAAPCPSSPLPMCGGRAPRQL